MKGGFRIHSMTGCFFFFWFPFFPLLLCHHHHHHRDSRHAGEDIMLDGLPNTLVGTYASIEKLRHKFTDDGPPPKRK
jgi:hypothetical protein